MTFRMLGFFFFSSSSSSSFSSSEIRNEFVQWAGMEICHTVHVPLLSVGWPTGDFFFWLDPPLLIGWLSNWGSGTAAVRSKLFECAKLIYLVYHRVIKEVECMAGVS